ncbi:NAD(+) diphosphatase [Microbulbifer celer]|uniref:NAD(+) diphosphatase n=1 Tax=Microbulbifer celer TaxID=435905 RepID=A0ABW3UDC6_9GAMM|nr:NAD(+) diphosphatase [Microbulbifer celer]UFN59046.1 NAD(+) diphosphatase [Microbulbifer celer]
MTEFVSPEKVWPVPDLHWHIVVCGGELLTSEDGFLFSRNPVHSLTSATHYLGNWAGRPCAVHLLAQKTPIAGHSWRGLRSFLGVVSEAEFALAGRALQVANWDLDHRFCGRCGGETDYHPRDRARVCHRCEFTVYPRISPCVIMLVTRGDECLLARHTYHRHGLYTALAGFMEPGESAEQALAREVKEEVGLDVGGLRYVGSQSWPFPGQLMIGFHAEVRAGELRLEEEEIAEARWFHRNDIPEAIPVGETLSGRLIRIFMHGR